MIISAHQVSRKPSARMMIYNGLTVAMGGNIEMDKTKPKMAVLAVSFSLARAKAAKLPKIMDRVVVQVATIKLFKIILPNGWAVNMDI